MGRSNTKRPLQGAASNGIFVDEQFQESFGSTIALL